MKARFNKVRNTYTNKFSFDNNTTLGIGNVQPLFCKQLAGGSKVSLSFGQLTRLSPLVVPTFARLKQRNDFTFVPMSMVMPSFDAFLSQSFISGTSRRYLPHSLPCITNQALFIALVTDPRYCQSTYISADDKYQKVGFTYSNPSFFSGNYSVSNVFANLTTLPTLKQVPLDFWDFTVRFGDKIFISSFGDGVTFCHKLTQVGRFWYTVLRGLGYTCDLNDIQPVSILPLWAFAKAYYDLYYPKRDSPWHMSNYYVQINKFYNGLFNSVDVGSLSYDMVSDLHVLAALFGTSSGFDFYATIDDSLATVATDNPINISSGASYSAVSVFDNGNFTDDNQQTESSNVLPFPGLQPDDEEDPSYIPSLRSKHVGQGGSAISADQLTLVNRLWNFVQKSSVVGQSVKDWFAVHLGCKTNEDMFDQTILVKSIVNDVSINPVISTAQTVDGDKGDNLGSLAGQGYASKNDSLSFEARSFGYFLCLTSLVPISGVSCGTEPEMYLNTVYEQQLPDFDGVGYEVLNKSSFNESIVAGNQRSTQENLSGGFGYVPRLSSWKTLHNIRSGNFAINSIKDSFIPYCVDTLPTSVTSSSILWRFPWANAGRFISFNRIFYNTAISYSDYGIQIPIDDNFMSQSVFEFSYTSYLKPLSDSFSVESLGKDLVSVKEQ